jgi:hypothetical protein
VLRDVRRTGEARRDGGLQDDGGDEEPDVGFSSLFSSPLLSLSAS